MRSHGIAIRKRMSSNDLLVILFGVALVLAISCGKSTEKVETSQPVDVRRAVRNAEYQLQSVETPVRLSAGRYEDEPSRVSVQLLANVRSGDLDGDESPEYVVVLASNTGGSGVFMELAVLSSSGKELTQRAAYYLGDRIKIEGVEIENGEILIDTITHGPEDAMCCPTQPEVVRLQLRNDELILQSAN